MKNKGYAKFGGGGGVGANKVRYGKYGSGLYILIKIRCLIFHNTNLNLSLPLTE